MATKTKALTPDEAMALVEGETSAETIKESSVDPSREEMAEYFQFFDCEMDKEYTRFNPAKQISGRATPITAHHLMTRFWRPVKIKRDETKVLVLVYPVGHPEHPNGAQQNVADHYQIWERPWFRREQEQAKHARKNNPGTAGATDQKFVQGKNGTMVLDTKNPVDLNDVGKSLPEKSAVAAEQARRDRAGKQLPAEFYNRLEDNVDKLAD